MRSSDLVKMTEKLPLLSSIISIFFKKRVEKMLIQFKKFKRTIAKTLPKKSDCHEPNILAPSCLSNAHTD